jgi:hypothetical protein
MGRKGKMRTKLPKPNLRFHHLHNQSLRPWFRVEISLRTRFAYLRLGELRCVNIGCSRTWDQEQVEPTECQGEFVQQPKRSRERGPDGAFVREKLWISDDWERRLRW